MHNHLTHTFRKQVSLQIHKHNDALSDQMQLYSSIQTCVIIGIELYGQFDFVINIIKRFIWGHSNNHKGGHRGVKKIICIKK